MNLLREIEVKLSARSDVQSAGPSAATGASGPAGWGSRIFGSQKMLNVQTECTYQALALIVPIRIGADDVLETLYPRLPRHGTPEYNRSDNGPEFVDTSDAVLAGKGSASSRPGSVPGHPGRTGKINESREHCAARCSMLSGSQRQSRPRSSSTSGSDSTTTSVRIRP